MNKREIDSLKEHARVVREKVLDMGIEGKGGHLAPGFSDTEILVSLFDKILTYDAQNPEWDERDRFILSKGHGCMPYYVLLAEKGFFDESHLNTFCKPGSILGCHADRNLIPGVEVTTGSLGLGLPVAVGMAWIAKHDGKKHKVYALLGDGESQEGTIWESLMYAGSNGLDNLTIIVDHNGYGATAKLENTANIAPLKEKLNAFKFYTLEANGHDFRDLVPAIQKVSRYPGKPGAVIAYTQKGRGVSFMEDAYNNGDPKWHYRIPNEEEIKIAKKDLSYVLEDDGSLNKSLLELK